MSAALSPTSSFPPVASGGFNVIIYPAEAHCNRHGDDYLSVPFCETFCIPWNYVSPFIHVRFPQVASAQAVSISIQNT